MSRIQTTRAGIILALLFAAALGSIAALTFYEFFSTVPDARLAREDIKSTFLVVRTASAPFEAIQDAERGQRGYLITGRDSYLEPGVAFLSKPYDRERLAMTLRRVLDGSAKNIKRPEPTGARGLAPSDTPSTADDEAGRRA